MKYKIALLFCISVIHFANANNIQVSNISLNGQNTTNKTVQVQFTVAWENSWRVSAGPGNWDAAWIFIKFRKGANGVWSHASLVNTGQLVPAGSSVTPGLVDPASAFNIATNPAVGAFVYRSANGSGNFSANNVQLRWNYGQDGLTDVDLVDVQVFGIEMVYVPTGIFAAGDGTSGNSQFTLTTINTGNPLLGPSGSGSLGGQAGGYPTGQLAPSTATWPNGYNAFYCMKYEISQQGYADFLNTLSRTQQASRVTSNISVGQTTITNRFVMTNTASASNRNVIACNTSVSGTAPVKFYCDYNNNSVGGESNDGKEIACNWIGWTDMTAYLAWAGLRPGTELEYEKCGRGNQVPVPGEFAWGNRNVSWATQIIDAGLSSEHANPDANLVGNTLLTGPLRNGALATATSGREQAGAGYYGIMELTGNLWERIVNISTTGGRNFAGSHGNGKLDANGNVAGNTDWPTSEGMGGRGGSFVTAEPDLQLSSRGQTTAITGRLSTYGGRGCRTAQ